MILQLVPPKPNPEYVSPTYPFSAKFCRAGIWSLYEPPNPLVVRIAGAGLSESTPSGTKSSPTTVHGVESSGPTSTEKYSSCDEYEPFGESASAGGEKPRAQTTSVTTLIAVLRRT